MTKELDDRRKPGNKASVEGFCGGRSKENPRIVGGRVDD